MFLDHLFICTGRGAPAGDLLVESGLAEGPANSHPGQGTANRRFFFANVYLELLWVADAAEACSEPASRLQIPGRCSWRESKASPFGLGFRPMSGTLSLFPVAKSREYSPPYLAGKAIQILQQTASAPLCFHLPFLSDGKADNPTSHPAGLKTVTKLTLTVAPTEAERLSAFSLLCRDPVLAFSPGGEPLLEMEFDDAARGQSRDFRPGLPLALRW
ncbi:MAG: VOC family protein [Deltaproteobacteria bacterium]|jgi:hypothetical protein|nr:VOC family protein [Deltaproteobacteria bacterium]